MMAIMSIALQLWLAEGFRAEAWVSRLTRDLPVAVISPPGRAFGCPGMTSMDLG